MIGALDGNQTGEDYGRTENDGHYKAIAPVVILQLRCGQLGFPLDTLKTSQKQHISVSHLTPAGGGRLLQCRGSIHQRNLDVSRHWGSFIDSWWRWNINHKKTVLRFRFHSKTNDNVCTYTDLMILIARNIHCFPHIIIIRDLSCTLVNIFFNQSKDVPPTTLYQPFT